MLVPRSRGAVSGFLLVLLGAWGALIPFIGPYLDYSWGTDQSWHWTTARLWLEVVPGAAVALGGLLLLISANRIQGSLGGWLAALGGAWFIVGMTLAPLLHTGSVGQPLSQHDDGRAVAYLGYFYGIGAVIVFLAAFALGRLAVVGVRDVLAADRADQRAAEQARAEEELARRRAAERDASVAAERDAARDRADDRVADDRVADDRVVDDRAVADRRVADERPVRDGRYEPDQPYGTTNQSADEPTTRFSPEMVGSDYGPQYGSGRSPAHQAPGEEGR